MSYFSEAVDFFTNKNHAPSKRVMIFILVLFSIYFINDLTGFTFYHSKAKQIEQLKSINKLLHNNTDTITNDTRIALIELEKETIERKNLVEDVYSYIVERSAHIKSISQDKNDVVFHISVYGISIPLIIILLSVGFYYERNNYGVELILGLVIIFIGTILGYAILYFISSYLIPSKLFGSWYWNYLINFIIQVFTIALLAVFFYSRSNDEE